MSATATPAQIHRAPQSRRKHQAILEAATAAFLEAGYGAATMDEIAVRAQVSKQTIYHHFGSKEVLFAAMVEERCERFLAPIADVEMKSGDLTESLRAIGVDFLTRVLAPDSLALHRLLIAESVRFPELGALSYESGPRRLVARLAQVLEAHARHGKLNVPDPLAAAEQFYGTLLGFRQLEAILRNAPGADPGEIARYVSQAVRLFFEGVSPRGAKP